MKLTVRPTTAQMKRIKRAMCEESKRRYKAIVWAGEAAGVKIEICAVSMEQASALLRERFGEEATFTVHNEEDAARPR